jgi:hypothetical protein
MQALDGRPSAPNPDSQAEAPEPYGFEILTCNTSNPEYRWMNFAVLITRVRFVTGAQGIEIVEFTAYRASN